MRFRRSRYGGYGGVRFEREELYVGMLDNIVDHTKRSIVALEKAIKDYSTAKGLLAKGQYKEASKFLRQGAYSIFAEAQKAPKANISALINMVEREK